MALTVDDVNNVSFSIDRKGYDVDEVDVFLEQVANEIDALNKQIQSLEAQLDSVDKMAGFDTVAADAENSADASTSASHVREGDEAALSEDEKDSRIAELESKLNEKNADDNAIAQALIIAQRSADEITSNAKAEAATTIKDAEDEASRILNKAENDKQKVMDAIRELEKNREDAREEYRSLLTDYITDANRKLAEIGDKPSAASRSYFADGTQSASAPSSAGAHASNAAASDVSQQPSNSGLVANSTEAPVPVASTVEKDLSGFGDAADAFDMDDLD
jgi:cell division initiation protein